VAKGEGVPTDYREEPISISVGAMNLLEDLIQQIDDVVRNARSMPLSNSAMVPRESLLELVESLKRSLPEEIARARTLLRDAEAVVERAKVEAERMIERARADRDKAIGKTEIVQAAAREAEKLVSSAESQAKRIKAEAEEYVEGKLANFEVALQKTLKAVERGRARLAGRLADAEEITAADDED
jgi:cell division septum initiation protein DivIVA